MKNYGVGKVQALNNGETIAIKVGASYFDIATDGEVKGEIEVTLDTTPNEIEGQGTKDAPFIIMSIEDLVLFSKQVNEGRNNYSGMYVELGKTLDFNSDLSYINPNTTEYDTYLGGDGTKGLKEQLTKGVGFRPIGEIESYEKNFRGSFNGKNNWIKNIKIDVVGNAGLFGVTAGEIKGGRALSNLTLTGDIKGTSQVGGLIGQLKTTATYHMGTGWDFRTIIENVRNECNLTNKGSGAYLNVGGIVGRITDNSSSPYCIIKNCQNSGDITKVNAGHSGLGGIVGVANGGTLTLINNCNSGNVKQADSSAYTGAGGMLGTTAPGAKPYRIEIYNCYNEGTIEGAYCGGLLGQTETSNLHIYNSYNFVDMSNINASIAYKTGNAIVEDVYYASDSEKYIAQSVKDTTITADNVRKVTSQEAKTSTFVDELNNNIQNGYSYKQTNSEGVEETITVDTTGWAKWVYNSGGYPTLAY